MSEVAGRVAIQAGAHHPEKPQGGAGLLLGGVVGYNAAPIATGIEARVTVIDHSLDRLAWLGGVVGNRNRIRLQRTGSAGSCRINWECRIVPLSKQHTKSAALCRMCRIFRKCLRNHQKVPHVPHCAALTRFLKSLLRTRVHAEGLSKTDSDPAQCGTVIFSFSVLLLCIQ